MKKMKLVTLGMVMCLSFAMMTGCGRKDNANDNKKEETTATEDTHNKDNKDNNNADHNNVNDATDSGGPMATGSDVPMTTENHRSVGEDIVDTVDNVGTDIVDGVTDVGRDLTGDDGTGNSASSSPVATHHTTATP